MRDFQNSDDGGESSLGSVDVEFWVPHTSGVRVGAVVLRCPTLPGFREGWASRASMYGQYGRLLSWGSKALGF